MSHTHCKTVLSAETAADRCDTVVIGAGVVGLAVARQLARAGREVIILESEGLIGSGASSRNSEVIHAGLYYPAGSLKARLCVRGKHALYDFCRDFGVAHRHCGKLIVATTTDQLTRLSAIKQKAAENGVNDLRLLNRQEAAALEPALEAAGALLSPSTGIVDSHGFMLALQGDAETHGAMIAFHAPVKEGLVTDNGVMIAVGGADPMILRAKTVINAAGLGAQRIAGNIAGPAPAHVPPLYLAKGNYFSLARPAPFSRLIYPVPEPGGLGVHLTLDLAGQARFGPDVEWIDDIHYPVDPTRGNAFYDAIRSYWPGLPDGSLTPDYAGIRPKLVAQGGGEADFVIQGPETHGIAGLINLFGIESPGLTAALAIAQRVADQVQ